jgi:hypothetical protein
MRGGLKLLSVVALLTSFAVAASSQDSPSPNGNQKLPSASREVPRREAPRHTLGGGDTCGTAVPIISLPFSDTGDTTGATDDVSDVPTCANPLLVPSDPGPDHIYSFTVSTGNNLSITVGNTSPYDTSIYVLSTCGNPATCVAYSDTIPGNPPETIALSGLSPGTYFLYIDSFYSANPGGPHFDPARAQGPYSISVTGTLGSTRYNTVTPCRVIDTRNPAGPYGGPALAHLGTRTFVLAGQCAIPPSARAVAVNIAVTQPTNGPGFLTLYPAGTTRPLFSSINYNAGQTRANNAIVPLGASGDINVYCAQGGGTVHFILDVNGYFQ